MMNLSLFLLTYYMQARMRNRYADGMQPSYTQLDLWLRAASC